MKNRDLFQFTLLNFALFVLLLASLCGWLIERRRFDLALHQRSRAETTVEQANGLSIIASEILAGANADTVLRFHFAKSVTNLGVFEQQIDALFKDQNLSAESLAYDLLVAMDCTSLEEFKSLLVEIDALYLLDLGNRGQDLSSFVKRAVESRQGIRRGGKRGRQTGPGAANGATHFLNACIGPTAAKNACSTREKSASAIADTNSRDFKSIKCSLREC